MTVKSIRGRRRYLAFFTSPGMTREKMVKSIPGGKKFNVIQCAEGMAIVRCAPSEFGECCGAVKTADACAEFATMSGTLRTLRDRYPVLKRNAPPKPSHGNTAKPPRPR